MFEGALVGVTVAIACKEERKRRVPSVTFHPVGSKVCKCDPPSRWKESGRRGDDSNAQRCLEKVDRGRQTLDRGNSRPHSDPTFRFSLPSNNLLEKRDRQTSPGLAREQQRGRCVHSDESPGPSAALHGSTAREIVPSPRPLSSSPSLRNSTSTSPRIRLEDSPFWSGGALILFYRSLGFTRARAVEGGRGGIAGTGRVASGRAYGP